MRGKGKGGKIMPVCQECRFKNEPELPEVSPDCDLCGKSIFNKVKEKMFTVRCARCREEMVWHPTGKHRDKVGWGRVYKGTDERGKSIQERRGSPYSGYWKCLNCPRTVGGVGHEEQHLARSKHKKTEVDFDE